MVIEKEELAAKVIQTDTFLFLILEAERQYSHRNPLPIRHDAGALTMASFLMGQNVKDNMDTLKLYPYMLRRYRPGQ